MNTEFQIKLESFEGPLDLLLFLIKKNEIDIYNIPIAKITEEYLITIELMTEMNLEVAGEFLLMASTLIFIKGKMLTPTYKESTDDIDLITEDPRSELVKLLEEYQKFQAMGTKLGEREILGRDVFKHPKEKTQNTETKLKDLDLVFLVKAYYKLIDKYQKITVMNDIAVPLKSINSKVNEIYLKYPNGFNNISLEELLCEPISKIEIIVTFLTILELSRMGFIKVVQHMDELLISTKKTLAKINFENEFSGL